MKNFAFYSHSMFNTGHWFFTISDIAGLFEKVEKKSWFEEWFDSPYYHVLYSHRDEDEANYFIKNLTEFLDVTPGQKALDLACGKGRHSKTLHDLGLDVVGLDLSPASIESAKSFETEGLSFVVGDMRDFKLSTKFNYVFNFFTSFGYFGCMDENLKVLNTIKNHLLPGGLLVIDFLNTEELEKNLVLEERVEKRGMQFNINRSIKNGFIQKDIVLKVDGLEKHFKEKVQALSLNDFKSLMDDAGFSIKTTFGSYSLDNFDAENSKRLIIIAEIED